MASTRVLGSLHLTSGQLVVGDAIVPLPGEVVEGVPSGRYEVLGTIDEDNYICSFEIRFGSGMGVRREMLEYVIDGVILLIADPRGVECATRHERKALRRAIYRSIRAEWARCRRAQELYVQTFMDHSGKPWGLAFIGGYNGDGCYDLVVDRINGQVARLSSVFIPPDLEE